MLTQEDLKALQSMIENIVDKKLDEKLEPIKQDLEEIKENAEITREATNYLLGLVEGKEKAIRKLM